MPYRILSMVCLLMFLFMAPTIAVPTKPIIKADTNYYDVNTGLYVLKGNVYIEVKNQIITAGQARANMGTMEIWGFDGVTLTQDDIALSADSVHVFSSQNRAVIEGGVVFKREGMTITANKVEFNWSTKLGIFTGKVTVIQGDKTWSAYSVTYNVDTNTFQ